MTAPSNANTSGLMQDLCERLDAILIEESPMHPFGCSTWEEASRIAIDMAKEVIVTAASAQARIAELGARLKLSSETGADLLSRYEAMTDRASAAEARADRLADIARLLDECIWFNPDTQNFEVNHDGSVEKARAALQQETQP